MATEAYSLLSRSPLVVASIVLIAAVPIVSWLLQCNQRPKTFPPGPPTIPIFGNLHQMPTKSIYVKFAEWSKQYGDIIGLKAGPQNMVIISSPQLIRETFVNRGVIYSGRPVLYVSRELLFPNQTNHMFMLQNDDTLRRNRTALKRLMGQAGLKEAFSFQETLTTELISNLSSGKESPERCVRLYMFRIAMTATMGPVADEGTATLMLDEWTHIQHRLIKVLEATMSSLFDMLPFLKYVPFIPGKQNARDIGAYLLNLSTELLGRLKFHLAQAKESGSDDVKYWGLIGNILRDQEGEKDDVEKRKFHFTDSQLKTMGQFVQDAATDTTLSTAMTCIMALTANQSLFRKVQEEVDTVCGKDGELFYYDIDRLPYVKACVLETLRWRPAAPILLPHRLEQDDHVRGYHIPRDTMIMANAWAANHDPAHFDEPDVFNPDRFLGFETYPGVYPFGIGRRSCPGDRFALNTLIIMLSKLAASFDFTFDGPAPDMSLENGYDAGVIMYPKTFPVKFIERRV
ncbi:hypothetical protein KVR01_003451 [Diaporthe batatas]|uniref:uncharacterized protein n=1 Tax=Diaporthe batatas TaxID=748121 RepID=UPI001D038DC2|nr:uncharacterized protein KVR01_003451 [Diaporthe batatas]KAG8167762.1 hypothetical protein KVR01_003451 [Diaporthe batatas]